MEAETDPDSPPLPSTVEESLSSCPKIVLVGNSGVGKSSLIQRIFKIDLNAIDIAHDRAGRANIEQEYTSKENTRFILHDSQGFEASSRDNWNIVERFLRDRSKLRLAHRVHAIWLCIRSPREGERVQETGDENLLALAKELNIPVIAVFTKYDRLVFEQYFKTRNTKVEMTERKAEEDADNYFNNRVRNFQQRTQVPIVRVSISNDYSGRTESLLELTRVTRHCLGDNEEAGVVPFMIAQRVNTSQKVELSVRQGFKKYWLNLGNSTFFPGHKLSQCIWRIHDDILKVWNFNDPGKLLSGEKFCAQMILLVNPMLEGAEANIPQDDILSKCLDVATAALTIASPFAIFLAAAGISLLALKFLYGTYKKIPPSAQYLGTYITALTCVLHLLFQETAGSESSDFLTEDLVLSTVAQYKNTQFTRHRNLIREMGVLHGFEKKIAKLILNETNTPETDSLTTLLDAPAPPPTEDTSSGQQTPSGDDQQEESQSGSQKKEKQKWWKRVSRKFSSKDASGSSAPP